MRCEISSLNQLLLNDPRQGEGYCFRLYTEESFSSMALSYEPEIRRCNLAESFLQLKCLNSDMEDLDFMDPPEYEAGMF